MIRRGYIVEIFKRLNTKYLIIGGIVLALLLVVLLAGHLIRGDSTEDVTTEVAELSYDYDKITKVFCRLTLYDNNEPMAKYEVASLEGGVFVFRDEENLGKSGYSFVSRECNTFEVKHDYNNYVDIEEYKDDFVTGLYNIDGEQLSIYIGQLINDGFSLNSQLDSPAITEIILEKNGDFRRCIIANNSLMMADIGSKNIFNANYYIDNYIY